MDMYGIFPYIYHKNQPNAGKYTIWMVWDIVIFPIEKAPPFLFFILGSSFTHGRIRQFS